MCIDKVQGTHLIGVEEVNNHLFECDSKIRVAVVIDAAQFQMVLSISRLLVLTTLPPRTVTHRKIQAHLFRRATHVCRANSRHNDEIILLLCNIRNEPYNLCDRWSG